MAEQLFYRFNNEHPKDYHSPSMSVSDIVAIRRVSRSTSRPMDWSQSSPSKRISRVTLADFYGVSVDYLLCRTENRKLSNVPLAELHLSDDMVELLKSGNINNRLLCEIATNDKFVRLMTDTEIYIDGHATARFRDINESSEI